MQAQPNKIKRKRASHNTAQTKKKNEPKPARPSPRRLPPRNPSPAPAQWRQPTGTSGVAPSHVAPPHFGPFFHKEHCRDVRMTRRHLAPPAIDGKRVGSLPETRFWREMTSTYPILFPSSRGVQC